MRPRVNWRPGKDMTIVHIEADFMVAALYLVGQLHCNIILMTGRDVDYYLKRI